MNTFDINDFKQKCKTETNQINFKEFIKYLKEYSYPELRDIVFSYPEIKKLFDEFFKENAKMIDEQLVFQETEDTYNNIVKTTYEFVKKQHPFSILKQTMLIGKLLNNQNDDNKAVDISNNFGINAILDGGVCRHKSSFVVDCLKYGGIKAYGISVKRNSNIVNHEVVLFQDKDGYYVYDPEWNELYRARTLSGNLVIFRYDLTTAKLDFAPLLLMLGTNMNFEDIDELIFNIKESSPMEYNKYQRIMKSTPAPRLLNHYNDLIKDKKAKLKEYHKCETDSSYVPEELEVLNLR